MVSEIFENRMNFENRYWILKKNDKFGNKYWKTLMNMVLAKTVFLHPQLTSKFEPHRKIRDNF